MFDGEMLGRLLPLPEIISLHMPTGRTDVQYFLLIASGAKSYADGGFQRLLCHRRHFKKAQQILRVWPIGGSLAEFQTHAEVFDTFMEAIRACRGYLPGKEVALAPDRREPPR